MENYFITLQAFTLEEYEIWKQLNKHCNYETNVTGYTVNQLVINSDKRLNLTTQKVRTILKKFKEAGYIEDIANGKGTKGKETRVRLTMKQQLFNNNVTNKSEQLQEVEDDKQQQSNNNVTTLSKKKEKDNNILYKTIIEHLNNVACAKYKHTIKKTQGHINARVSEGFTVEDFEKVIDYKAKEWIGTKYEKFLRPETLFGTKFESYLNEANKKTPTAIGAENKNIKVNPSICNNTQKYSSGRKMV